MNNPDKTGHTSVTGGKEWHFLQIKHIFNGMKM